MKGSELKKLLEQRGWTQSAMAEEIDIGERTMRDHLARKLVPKNIEIAVLCILNHTEKRK